MSAKPVNSQANLNSPTVINSWESLQSYITALVNSLINEFRDHALVIGDLITDVADLETRVDTAEADIDAAELRLDALEGADYVNTIEGASGAFTLDETSGIELDGHDIQLRQGSASQFGAVKVDNSTITASGGVISAVASTPSLSNSSNTLGADVALNNTANYFDGPSLSLGTGTWVVITNLLVIDTGATARIDGKLWDGTNVFDSRSAYSSNTARGVPLPLAAIITLAGTTTIKASARDVDATTGKILFNQTGNSKDSRIIAFKVAP